MLLTFSFSFSSLALKTCARLGVENDCCFTIYRVKLLNDLYAKYQLSSFCPLKASKQLKIPCNYAKDLFLDLIHEHLLIVDLDALTLRINPEYLMLTENYVELSIEELEIYLDIW